MGKFNFNKKYVYRSKGRGRKLQLNEEGRAFAASNPVRVSAKAFNISQPTVSRMLREENIQPQFPTWRQNPGEFIKQKYPGLKEKLGTEVDNVLAAEYNLSRERIRQFRSEFDVPRANVPPNTTYIEVYKDIGFISDEAIADKHGISLSQVKKYLQSARLRRIKEKRQLVLQLKNKLGKVPDTVLAKQTGLNYQFINRVRNDLGIAPMTRRKIDRNKVKSLVLQGKSDKQIAKELNCSSVAIGLIRRGELGILRGPKQRVLPYDRMKAMIHQGLSNNEIANELDCSPSAIKLMRVYYAN